VDTNATSHFRERTEPKSASHAPLETHVLPKTDVEQATHAFVALDPQWQVVYLNRQAEDVLRSTRRELLGKNLWEAMPDYVGSPLYRYCQQAVSSGKAAEFEVHAPRSQKWFRIDIFPSPGEISIFLTEITEQKRAEEQLQFQAMISQHISDSVIVTDLQGRITYWNEAASALFGYTAEEMLEKTPARLYPGRDMVQPVQDFERLLAGFDYLGEWEGRRKDGTAVWVDIKTTILRDTQGKAIGLIGFAKDITARKQAEERLRQSEKHFRALIENNADGIALTDENGIITYASPSTTRMVGYLPEEFVGGLIFGRKDYLDGGEATRRLMARVLEEPRKSQVLEIRTGHKNGTFLWMEVVGINLLDEPGVEAIVWNFHDVTQRKQLEQEVARAKEQLEAILHNVADGITVVDANDRLAYVNGAVAYLSGFASSTELLAALQAGVVHRHEKFTVWDEWGQLLPASERPTTQALRGKQAKALLQYQNNATGQSFWTLVRAQPIFDAHGQVQFVVTVYTDITEQKELEQRKDNFISMASHELKTPLTILSAFTQLLHEQFAAEGRQDVVQHLSKMEAQVTNLTKLVVDLLDISKMQAGQLELALEAVDLDELVQGVVENLQPTTTHHLLIEGTAQRHVIGDRDRLGQVLIILLTNAIKYSPRADTIFVRVAHTRDTLTVRVQDFGIGIAQSHQQRLFQRFYRVLSEKDKTYPGLGIGLYIAHEIIERHGGKIWVESVEGKGSTFSFSLPLQA